MGCEGDTATKLREAGYRLTPQRLLIASALRHSGSHVSAAEIAERVRETYPVVDVSTVYRTLDMLKRLGLATATDMAASDVVFEWASEEPHHHLVCSECGGAQVLDHAYLENLAASIRDTFGFEPALHHFAIFGTCRACREAAELSGSGTHE